MLRMIHRRDGARWVWDAAAVKAAAMKAAATAAAEAEAEARRAKAQAEYEAARAARAEREAAAAAAAAAEAAKPRMTHCLAWQWVNGPLCRVGEPTRQKNVAYHRALIAHGAGHGWLLPGKPPSAAEIQSSNEGWYELSRYRFGGGAAPEDYWEHYYRVAVAHAAAT